MKQQTTRRHSPRIHHQLHALTIVCFLTAILQSAALGLLIAFLQDFEFARFDLNRLLVYQPAHELLWRALCLASGSGAISLLCVTAGWSDLISRRFQSLTKFAIIAMGLAAYAALDSYFMMMTQFSDLARDVSYSYSPSQLSTIQLASLTITQFLTKLLLISNTLESVAGIVLALSSFLTDRFPRPVAWLGLVLWLGAINASVLASLGHTDLALKVYFGSRLLLIVWAAAFGSACAIKSAQQRTPGKRSGEAARELSSQDSQKSEHAEPRPPLESSNQFSEEQAP